MRKTLWLVLFSFLFVGNLYSQRGGGVCNSKATLLEKPAFAIEDNRKKTNGSVNVQIKIDKEGNVSSAKSLSASPLLHKEAEESALKSKFEITKLSGIPVEVSCVIIYNVYLDETFNPNAVFGGVINGMATNLVKPKHPPMCKSASCGGRALVQVIFDTFTRETESAAFVSGHILLKEVSLEAVLNSTFKTHDHFEAKNLKKVGFVVYNFGNATPDSKNVFSPQALKLSQSYKKMDTKIRALSAYSLDSKMWSEIENSPLVRNGKVNVEIELNKSLRFRDLINAGLENIRQINNKKYRGRIDVRKLVDLASLNQVEKINEFKVLTISDFNSKPIFFPKPKYSASLKAINIKSEVIVEILVDEDGNVEEAKIVSGHSLLWKVCLEAAQQVRFNPPRFSNNTPIKFRGTLVYKFQ